MATNVSRRALMKGAAAGAFIIAAGSTTTHAARALAEGAVEEPSDARPAAEDGSAEDQPAPQEAIADQYGFWINTANCEGCFDCIDACSKANHTRYGEDRLSFYSLYDAEGVRRTFLVGCQHCSKPACASVCPAGAITKGAGGIVTVNKDRCIGCKYCYQACPFGVPKYTAAGMDKCDYCTEAGIALGQQTNCAKACKYDALHCGPIDELLAQSEGRGQVIPSSTAPNVLFS